jgi:hypothetical protein
MKQSIIAVLVGILLALGIGVLVILGIIAPVFTRFFGQALASTAVPTVLLIFAAAFAFYFGGMIASYRAPSRRRLHGTLVGFVSFAVSPIVNLFTSIFGGGNDPFANLRTPAGVLLSVVLFAAVLGASYIGARRGETIYAHNTEILRQRERRRRREQAREEAAQEASAPEGQ